MRTRTVDPDLEIAEIVSFEGWVPNAVGARVGEATEVHIDGAHGYQLRLIPSNKVLGRFRTTLEAWPAIIAAVASGRSSRTLSLDWIDADGCPRSIAAGLRLEPWARRNRGECRAVGHS